MNIKDIASTLAILGTSSILSMGCSKDPPATEVPGGDVAAPSTDVVGEASCAEGHTEEGHCAGDEPAAEEGGEASCSGEAEGGEASCSGEADG